MTRYAAQIEYDGTSFAGWQYQDHARTVQQVVEAAFSQVADHAVKVVCSGRTDAGVHAIGQVIHFDSEAIRPEKAWVFGANTHLPRDVSVRWIRPVPDRFSARFSALARQYRYVVFNHRLRPTLWRNRVAWYHWPVDVGPMQQAAQHLVGEHDFSSFRAAGCQSRTPMRRVDSIRVMREGDYVYLDLRANAFLHHMVRNIVGSLLRVGRGEHSADWIQEVLLARDRRLAGVTAPAEGLYFVHVEYAPELDFPAAPQPPIFACNADRR
jgi:tRNA pseudouridine38-40 synthase